MPTGGGKTIIQAALLGHWNLPSLVTVHQINILEHLKEDIEKSLGIEVGVIQGPQKIIHRFNIGTVQTLSNCLERASRDSSASEVAEFIQTECRVWIADETHHVAANQFTYLSNRLYNTYYRVGLSATPYREDGADLALEAALGRRIFEMSCSDLIRQKKLAKPYIFFVSYAFDKKTVEDCPDCGGNLITEEVRLYTKCSNSINVGKKEKCNHSYLISNLDESAYCPKCNAAYSPEFLEGRVSTRAKHKFGICKACGNKWRRFDGVRKRGIVRNEGRNALIVQYASRFIKKGKSVLILVQYKEHCLQIYEMLKHATSDDLVEYAMGGVEDRSGMLERLHNKQILGVVATSVFGEGVNIPSLNLLILAKGSSTKTDVIQTVGRVLRRTAKKKKVIVIDFEDKFKAFSSKSKFRKEILQEEPEFVVRDLVGQVSVV